jgi:hypothetical protein
MQNNGTGRKNMFDFFKRSTPVKPAAPRSQATTSRASAVHRSFDHLSPQPKAEVTEGNDEADWSLWEDSVAFQDSQTPSQHPNTEPAPLEAVNAKQASDSSPAAAYDDLRDSDL